MSLNKKILLGTIKRHPDGFGFFIPEDTEHPDVYIPSNGMNTAMTNDKVSITVEKERDGRFRGDIVRIEERSQKNIAGKFTRLNERIGIIKDEGKGWGQDLRILIEKSMNAKDGELVAAKITKYPDLGKFEGEVVEVIGDALNPLNDIKRVVITQNITEKFTEATLEEAKQFSQNPTEKDFGKRKDLRHLPIITIDGATAKDFDDAIYVEMTDQGFHLYVAIADVSHYVKPGTAMDKDAYERGTSVYFPNFVIPMLPEALSNGLCSLNPHVPRLALVAEMTFDFTGEMKTSDFYEGVIESKARVTYGEAQELIDGNPSATTLSTKQKEVQENIFRSADLAKILMAKRFKEGSLDLEVAETELVIDGTGEPIDVIKSERLFAHRLIEEMMLAANVAVAKFLASKEVPAFYRVHEEPNAEKIGMLTRYLKNFGASTTVGTGKLQKRLTRILQEFDGKPEEQIVHILTLRSMSQAKYTKENLGHFGLGFDFYTHFTSPIRRYPDLIVHRLLKNLAIPGSQYRLISEEDLATAGTWLSACEQKSAKAERQIQAIKKARFMKKMEGEEFDGLISSVTKFGVFVLLRQFNIDGLVRLDDLGLDKWEFDEENLTLSAKRSGQMYKMGDNLKVIVSAVDIELGQINFIIDKEKKDNHTSRHKLSSQAANSKNPNNKSFEGDSRRKNNKSYSHEKKKNNSPPDRPGKNFSTDKKKKLGFGNKKSEAQGRANSSFAPKTFKPVSFFKPAAPTAAAAVPTAKPSGPYEIKPRYASLGDYLDQTRTKKDEESTSTKSTKKSSSGTSSHRKDSSKRESSQDNSGGFRKARPEKSGRKNKSR